MPKTPNALLRLRKHADYQRVYGFSRKQFSRETSYFFCLRPADRRSDTPGPRIGLTVGKPLGMAVDRNRIKRRLRELVRRHAAELGSYPVDVILHPRRTALTTPSAALEAEVLAIFRAVRRLLDRGAGAPVPQPPRSATPRPKTSKPARPTPAHPAPARPTPAHPGQPRP